MDDDLATVIALPGATEARQDHNARESELDELPIRIAKRDWEVPYCSHRQALTDPQRRVVTCANPNCGAELDAFDFLEFLGREWENQTRRVQILRKEEDKISARLITLRRDEANTKARLRTARKKIA